MQKANNEALSPKSLNKLVRVANADVGISIRDAQRLFKENKPIATNIHTKKLGVRVLSITVDRGSHPIHPMGNFTNLSTPQMKYVTLRNTISRL